MDVSKITKQPKGRKQKHITIRVSDNVSQWLTEMNYSPTKIFYAAIDDLGYQKWKAQKTKK